MHVLALGAHPDDIEYGCGGTLALYAQQGHSVTFWVATHGGAGGDPDARLREQGAALVRLGALQILWGGYKDTEVPTGAGLVGPLEEAVKRVAPEVVLVNAPDDTHQDHRALAQAALSATRYVPNVAYFETPSSVEFLPTFYIDIANVFDVKLAALAAHRSQIAKTRVGDSSILELARATANFRGLQVRVKYAEAFQSVRLLLDLKK